MRVDVVDFCADAIARLCLVRARCRVLAPRVARAMLQPLRYALSAVTLLARAQSCAVQSSPAI
jgi:hypothetical protein